ncbi:hypothetical protein SLS56_009586 [Neofusicoccum ribis]|uniref:Integral membrane protein n=1 Tax=Neofusicoccum ribis TaxID=45134 RepID=A0ABR3SHE6_9PEZI
MTFALEVQKLLTWVPRDDAQNYTPADIPLAGRTISMILSLVTLCVISVCITRRVQNVHRWSTLPLGAWYIVLIYVDSFLFIFITTVFKDVGLNETMTICRGAILLCLTLYLSTKVCVYLFLVEKAYIVRGSNIPRYRDPLYVLNITGAMAPYGVLAILNIIWRFSRIDNGTCVIGMEKKALLPLIVFDVAVNIYLTTLFIVPLRQLYSYKSQANATLHTMAVRTFIGSCATLASSITNLTLLMVLDGEPAWVCFLSCNVEILFSVLILHWVTSRDRTGQTTNRSYSRSGGQMPSGGHGGNAEASGSNPLSSSSRSRTRRDAKTKIGTETLISEHYGAVRGGETWPDDTVATTTVDGGWPDDTRAVIDARCERAGGGYRGEGGGIALDRIVVTKESEVRTTRDERRHTREVSGARGMGRGGAVVEYVTDHSDGRSETETAGSASRREGSTDGIVRPDPTHMV